MSGRLLSAVALGAALTVLACGGAKAPAAAPDVYSVRGEIRALPGAGGREVMIHHEAIPALRDASGKTFGMESMTMSFPVAPEVELSGLAIGDRVEFGLEVRWDARDPVRVIRLAKLPPGAPLAFDEPQPEAVTPK
jgi:Cu/Ag efflux protein CusF